MLWSASQVIVYLIGLTVPWGDLVEETYERKKFRYADSGVEAKQGGELGFLQ